ncbi:YdcF family protein [Anianabacter salinae]|uniref:YdcF family protein n=1 Tax=Anianabacter salinae TaxID=2851023 RepID=UPI00225E20E5|nr:YdcF family protein [Anianabacter salinae]MBV0913452.1 YdcF family protein [Anianabacter salinae]
MIHDLASDIVHLLVRPETWLAGVLLLALIAILRNRRRSAALLVAGCFGFVVLVGYVPVGDVLLRPLETRFNVPVLTEAPTGIVVLGGPEDVALSNVWGQPVLNGAGERIVAAIGLATRYPEARVLLTGRTWRRNALYPSEADVARDVLVSAGIAPDRITIDTEANNTAQNARNLIDATGAPTGDWLLVTSAFHMPRSVGTFCAGGWALIPYPVDFRTGAFRHRMAWNLAPHWLDLATATREWAGLVAYRLLGRTEAVFPGNCR